MEASEITGAQSQPHDIVLHFQPTEPAIEASIELLPPLPGDEVDNGFRSRTGDGTHPESYSENTINQYCWDATTYGWALQLSADIRVNDVEEQNISVPRAPELEDAIEVLDKQEGLISIPTGWELKSPPEAAIQAFPLQNPFVASESVAIPPQSIHQQENAEFTPANLVLSCESRVTIPQGIPLVQLLPTIPLSGTIEATAVSDDQELAIEKTLRKLTLHKDWYNKNATQPHK